MKIALSVVVLLASLSAVPAVSQEISTDEQDAYFESCKREFIARNMGDDNAASAYCYRMAYGDEGSGGGAPNQYPVPNGQNCYGHYDPIRQVCNPNERPD